MERGLDEDTSPTTWCDIENPMAADGGIHDLETAERVCRAALTILRPRLTAVVIDAYTDYRKQLKHTPAPAAAQDALRERGAARGRGDPGMQVRLDPAHGEDWTLAMTYAAWSINVDLYAKPNEAFVGEFHDCGHSISLNLSAEESRQLAEHIGPDLIVTPCERPDV